jgi:hypothetical protein
MNSTVIDGVRGVNRLEAFLDSQAATGLCEVDPAELQAVEGGLFEWIVTDIDQGIRIHGPSR